MKYFYGVMLAGLLFASVAIILQLQHLATVTQTAFAPQKCDRSVLMLSALLARNEQSASDASTKVEDEKKRISDIFTSSGAALKITTESVNIRSGATNNYLPDQAQSASLDASISYQIESWDKALAVAKKFEENGIQYYLTKSLYNDCK